MVQQLAKITEFKRDVFARAVQFNICGMQAVGSIIRKLDNRPTFTAFNKPILWLANCLASRILVNFGDLVVANIDPLFLDAYQPSENFGNAILGNSNIIL